jgi:hypothetical protein
MDESLIRQTVKRLDTANTLEMEAAWELLRPLGDSVVPFLIEFYPHARKAQGRVALVFHLIRYARVSEDAFNLGITALDDKATLVRYRACGLCAYSLRKDALPHLEKLRNHVDIRTAEDARAAIDAIRKQNHHYFVDRNHSDSSFWEVNPGDVAA